MLNVVDTDEAIGETSEEFLAGGVPGDGGTDGEGLLFDLVTLNGFGFEDSEGLVGVLIGGDGLDVPDLDALVGTGGDPLETRVECDGVDGGSSIELLVVGGQVGDVPNAELLVLASSSDVLGVGGDGACIDVAVVGLERELVTEVLVPDLEVSVPANRNDVGRDSSLAGGG